MLDLPLAHFALSKSGWACYRETHRSAATKHCRDVAEDLPGFYHRAHNEMKASWKFLESFNPVIAGGSWWIVSAGVPQTRVPFVLFSVWFN